MPSGLDVLCAQLMGDLFAIAKLLVTLLVVYGLCGPPGCGQFLTLQLVSERKLELVYNDRLSRNL